MYKQAEATADDGYNQDKTAALQQNLCEAHSVRLAYPRQSRDHWPYKAVYLVLWSVLPCVGRCWNHTHAAPDEEKRLLTSHLVQGQHVLLSTCNLFAPDSVHKNNDRS